MVSCCVSPQQMRAHVGLRVDKTKQLDPIQTRENHRCEFSGEEREIQP